MFVRVERLAATLPPADADIVRKQMQAHHDAIETGPDRNYQAAREEIRETLRQDPFKVEDMRAAMAKTRAARQTYDQDHPGRLRRRGAANDIRRTACAGRLAVQTQIGTSSRQ